MNLLKQIAEQLACCGLGRTAGEEQDIFWARMPDVPDTCICVLSGDSAVSGSDRGAQIRILNRGRQPGEAYETACAIAEAMDGFRGFLAGDGADARIDVTAAAAGMGEDARKRELYSTEMTVHYCAG